MPENPYFAATAIVCHLLLGFVVFLTNPRRPINRSFLLLTVVTGGWVSGIELTFTSYNAHWVAFWIRECSVWGGLAVPTFMLLRNSLIHPEERWSQHFWRTRWWLLAGLLEAVFCLSPLYLRGISFVAAPGNGTNRLVPRPDFAPTVVFHFAYILFAAAMFVRMMIVDLVRPRTTGAARVEVQFAWLGAVIIALSVLVNIALQPLLHGAYLTHYAAMLRVILFDIIIAYGITARGILQIRAVLRLALSYLLLTVYSGLLFSGGWFALRWSLLHIGVESDWLPVTMSGVLVAVLVNTAATPLRRLARSILPPNDLDVEVIVSRVSHLLQSVTTLDELLEEFSAVISRSVGVLQVRILLPGVSGFCEHDVRAGRRLADPDAPVSPEWVCLAEDDPVVTSLQAGRQDIAMEELVRHASTAEQRRLLGRLRSLGADLIVPARFRSELSAIVLFSPRHGGRIYGGDGRSTLRLISEQLGVAIVNAHLYTEAQQSQAYNRLLVEHLPCGVITMDRGGAVNVINPEARRLLQVDEHSEPSDVELPPELTELVHTMRRNEQDLVGEEIVLRPTARDQAHLRAYCLPFTGEEGERLGTVLVLNDHTTLERLQRQVRQADRLASIGTLASGMAHEIKNPLTALKTFTQLLPKRYDDAEFRSDFSGLAGSEIARIERIVNQLLAFARPAPLMIEQVNLHEVIENAMRLVGPQAARQNVTIRKSFLAHQDFIAADKDRLQQVLLNLILNALQASSEDGWIELSTELEPVTDDQDALIRLDVRDAGSGIPADKLPHIFDPFFTTKSEGTGLGLSVSYNIVAEHKGRLEVQSEPGKGTCFSIYLPVH